MLAEFNFLLPDAWYLLLDAFFIQKYEQENKNQRYEQ
jgi:hypothetical protein